MTDFAYNDDKTMPAFIRECLTTAKTLDPKAEAGGEGAWDCLFIDKQAAPAVIAALGDHFDYEDDQGERGAGLTYTLVVVKPT